MSKVEICVATVDNDLSILKNMNINSDICIANQTGFDGIKIDYIDNHLVKIISTKTKGVGLNRNLSLLFSSNEILMLADDDIVYHNGYEKLIEEAFSKNDKADIIIFRMQFIKNGEVFEVDNFKNKRVHFYNGLSFGTYAIAIKRSSLLKANISFTELFGGGCIYGSGEDSLFLINCFRKGLKIYTSDHLIGDNIRDSSSWFKGYNEKFYFDKGAFIACAFPKYKKIMMLYYLFVYRKMTEISTKNKKLLLKAGMKSFQNLVSYNEWAIQNEKK